MTHVSYYIDVRLALTWPDQQALFLAPDKVVANRSLINWCWIAYGKIM